jgi:hypothetical protein
MLTKGDRYIKALQAFIEYKWQEYPHFIELLESMTFDELMAKLIMERDSRLYAQKRFEWISRVVDTIDKVYEAAPDDVKHLVQVKYWSDNKTNWAGVAE